MTVGLSEFDAKETTDRVRSGYGVELTLKVPALERDQDKPPAWAANLLQKVGRLIFWSEQTPRHGTFIRTDRTEPWGFNNEPIRVVAPREGFGLAARPLEFASTEGPLSKMHRGLRTARPGHDERPPAGHPESWGNPLVDLLSALYFETDTDLPEVETPNGRVDVVRVMGLTTQGPLEPALLRARQQFADGFMRRSLVELTVPD